MIDTNTVRKEDIKEEDEIEILTEEDDDVEIKEVDDTPEKDKGKPVAKDDDDDLNLSEEPDDEELKSYSARVQARIKKLTADKHAERRAKEARDRQLEELAKVAKAALDKNAKLTELVNKGETVWKESSKSSIDARVTAAKAKFKKAYEDGEFDTMTEAQAEMSKLYAESQAISAWQPTPIQKEEIDLSRFQPVQADPKASDWHSRNQWFGNDRNMTQYALSYHTHLVNSGHNPNSDDYYAALDDELKRKYPDKFEKPKAASNGKASPIVDSGARTQTKKPRSITLTKSQLAIAAKLGVTPRQYADELLKEQADDR